MIDLSIEEIRLEQFLALLAEYDDTIYAVMSNAELTGEQMEAARARLWELYLKTRLL